MMSKKFLLILEITWIITGVLSIAAGIRYLVAGGGKMFFIFPLITLVAFLFAWIRHRERKKG